MALARTTMRCWLWSVANVLGSVLSDFGTAVFESGSDIDRQPRQWNI